MASHALRFGLVFALAASAGVAPLGPTAAAAERVVEVSTDDALREALGKAKPGDRIRLAAGRYRPGVSIRGLAGTAAAPIVIEGADRADPPLFEGGGVGIQLSDCSHLTLRDLRIKGASGNGVNADDGGSYETPTRHLVLERIRVEDIGPRGNTDGIKLSGVDDFVVRDCEVEGWGGQAIDMVGCHRGLIEGCTFRGRDGFAQASGPQTKGGSSEITIRRSSFFDGGGRAVNIGGSTGKDYFRPKGVLYEAKDITVEGCTFVGSDAPIAFVGVDGAIVRHNTIVRPRRWVLRILQETQEAGFAPCRGGRFERNLIVFDSSQVRSIVNVGPGTEPASFSFAENLWHCEDRPAASRPELPAKETGGAYDIDPELRDPAKGDFKPGADAARAFGAGSLPAGDAPKGRGRAAGR
jgi:hypothetical protein